MTEPDTKAKRREKKKRPRMKVTGKEVFKLRDLKIRGTKKLSRKIITEKKPIKKG